MKIIKNFYLFFLLSFSASFALNNSDDADLIIPDLIDYTGFSGDSIVSWDDIAPTSFDPDMPEEVKEDIVKSEDIVVYIPFFGYIIVKKQEDSNGNRIWKAAPDSQQKVVKLGDAITFSNLDLLIDKDKRLTFSAGADINGTKGKIILNKSKSGAKAAKIINIYGAKFVFDFVNKPTWKPFSGASITADKIELAVEKNLVELSADFKDAQVADFGKIDKGSIRLSREKGENPILNMTGVGSLNLPEIGQVSYKLTSSLNTSGNFLLKASLKDINYKSLNLKKVKAVFNTESKDFKIKGKADLFGLDVVITLKRASDKWLLKGKISKDTILSMPFYDGRVLDFTKAEFLIEKDQILIKAYSKIDTMPITLTLIAAKNSSAQFEINDITLAQLVPSTADTKVGDIKIHNILGKIKSGKIDIFSPKVTKPVVLPSEDPDFDDLDVPDYDYKEYTADEEGLEFLITAAGNLSAIVPTMKNLDVQVTASGGPKAGFFMDASLDNIEFPEFGKIANARAFVSAPACGLTYVAEKNRSEKEKILSTKDKDLACAGLAFGISGQGETKLPKIGTVKYLLSASFAENNALIIKADIGDILYEGINIEKAYVMFNTKTNDFEIIGHANLANLVTPTKKKSDNIADLRVKVVLKRDTSQEISSIKYYKFNGIVENEIKPIKSVPVTILNGSVSFDKDENYYKFGIAGDIKIEDHIISSTSRYIHGPDNDLFSISASLFEAGPKAKDWTLSSLSPVFKNTPFEGLHCSAAYLIISSDSYLNEEIDEQVAAGINFIGDFEDFITPFGSLKSVLGNTKNSARVFGSLNFSNIRDSFLGIKFDVGLKDLNAGSKIKSGGLGLAISGKPDVEFEFSIVVDIDPSQSPLGFAFSLKLDELANVEVAGDMNGCWKDPFKIRGLSVCELGLDFGINIPQFIASGIPAGFGIKGYIEVPGSKKRFVVAIGVNSTSPEQNYLVAELEGELALTEIVGFALELATAIVNSGNNKLISSSNIDLKNIPQLSIKDVLLKIVPPGKSVTVGDEIYTPGFTFRGKMNLFGKNALVNIQTSELGVSGEGYLEKVEIKDLLLLTGAGPDAKYGTADDGAYVSVAITPLDQHFFVTGKIAIGLEKFRIFESETNIYISALEGLKFSSQTSLFGTDIQVSMTVIIPGVKDVLKDKNALRKTSLDILFKNEFSDKLKADIIEGLKEADKAMKQAAIDANKAFDQAIKDLQDQKNAGIKKANDDLDNLQKQLNNTKSQLDRLDKGNPSNWGKAAELGIAIGTLEASVRTGKELVNSLGKPVLTATQEIIDKAGRVVSDNVLKGTNLVVQVGGKYVVVEGLSTLYQAFSINEVYFHGSVGEIEKGRMPKLKVVITLSGKRYTIDGELDFRDIGKSIERLANTVKDNILKLFNK